MNAPSPFSVREAKRPPGWRHLDAWREEEAAPCGETAMLKWHYWTALNIRKDCDAFAKAPDLSDCRATVIGRNRLLVWEPLQTKAPGPPIASAFCCYIQTVIFYHQPYYVWPFKKRYSAGGKLQACHGGFLEWDQIETRIGWNDRVEYRGLIFDSAAGRVLWVGAPGERRRWWMRRTLRRSEAQQ